MDKITLKDIAIYLRDNHAEQVNKKDWVSLYYGHYSPTYNGWITKIIQKLTDDIFENGYLDAIPQAMFEYNHNIKEIELPDCVKYISNYAFNYSDIESLILPEGFVYIEKDAFGGCDKLNLIVIKGDVDDIDLTNGAEMFDYRITVEGNGKQAMLMNFLKEQGVLL